MGRLGGGLRLKCAADVNVAGCVGAFLLADIIIIIPTQGAS